MVSASSFRRSLLHPGRAAVLLNIRPYQYDLGPEATPGATVNDVRTARTAPAPSGWPPSHLRRRGAPCRPLGWRLAKALLTLVIVGSSGLFQGCLNPQIYNERFGQNP